MKLNFKRRLDRILRKARRKLDEVLLRAGARSKFLARAYYAIWNNSFGFEQKAFLNGRQAYQGIQKKPDGSHALLRRNTHRLEKGLLMRPRRVPFAMDYIKITVDAFAAVVGSERVDQQELRWSNDVLSEYFRVNSDHSNELKALRLRFDGLALGPLAPGKAHIPYERDLTSPSPVSFDSLMALAVRRRSVRWFLQRHVPRELVDKAIVLGTLAPSACNRQPFEFRIFDDPEVVQKVIKVPFGLAGYGHNVPVVVAIVGKLRNFFSERDRHLIYIDGSLAAMGFVFALEALGLSSCCVNWPEIDSNNMEMARLLGLMPDERPVMLVALGYPDPEGMVACSTKKSLQAIRRYNFE